MAYAYVLSTYSEDGLTAYRATLERNRLETLLTEYFLPRTVEKSIIPISHNDIQGWGIPQPNGEVIFYEKKEQAEQTLQEESKNGSKDRILLNLQALLAKSDEELANSGWNLTNGWGGIQLYAIELI